MNAIERYFGINGENTTLKTEILAGVTTFLTMAYIIFVNPSILSETGMPKDSVFVATCLASAVGCFIMGLYARLPVALAPGMGLNAFFTYGVVLGMGYDWQTALGAVFLSGCIFVVLSLFKIREWVINAIPMVLKLGIVAGIGGFLAVIALNNSGLVVSRPSTLVAMGDLHAFSSVMTALGFFVTVGLAYKKVTGAVTIGILLVTVIAVLTGHVAFNGVMAPPPSMAPTLMALNIAGALDVGMISVIFAFLFVDLFDTTGSLIGVASKAGLMGQDGRVPNMNKALLADSSATVVGSLFGTSSTTSYLESTSGVVSGGRTGLVAVTVGVLFLLSIFFAPLAGMIPSYATSGAILYVAVLMLSTLREIDWDDLTEAVPVAVIFLMTPLSYSVADGIALGFVSYTVVKAIAGKFDQISPAVWVLTVILLGKMVFLT